MLLFNIEILYGSALIVFNLSELSGKESLKNPELADVNLDSISDEDLSKLFQSEEVRKLNFKLSVR